MIGRGKHSTRQANLHKALSRVAKRTAERLEKTPKDLREFVREQAKHSEKTEAALRKLGYGPALDHDKALLESMGRIVPPSTSMKK